MTLQIELVYTAADKEEADKIVGQASRSRRDTSAAAAAEILWGTRRRGRREASDGSSSNSSGVYMVTIRRAYSMEPISMHELGLFVRMQTAPRELRPRLVLGGLRASSEWPAAQARFGILSYEDYLVGCFLKLRVNVIALSSREMRHHFKLYNRNMLFVDQCPLGRHTLQSSCFQLFSCTYEYESFRVQYEHSTVLHLPYFLE